MNPTRKQRNTKQMQYDPTAAEIKEACARFRTGWSKRERLKRSGEDRPIPWTPPMIDAEALRDAVRDSYSNR